jgi:acyl-[acyl-carrier-protein] desaturase
MRKLIVKWDIANLNELTDEAQKARDFVMALPNRMERISQRIKIPQEVTHFKWVNPAMVK